MVLGVGVDILKMSHLLETNLQSGDAFLIKTFSQNEIAQAASRSDPVNYYAVRFCGKEAVFKSLGIDLARVMLCEIEIVSDEYGRPSVKLHGDMAAAAAQKSIDEVLVSLSYDSGYAQAFAIAQRRDASCGKESI